MVVVHRIIRRLVYCFNVVAAQDPQDDIQVFARPDDYCAGFLLVDNILRILVRSVLLRYV